MCPDHPPKAHRSSGNNPEKGLVRLPLIARITFPSCAVLSGLISTRLFLKGSSDAVAFWWGLAAAGLMLVASLPVVLSELRWDASGLFLRTGYRHGKWYAWSDIRCLRGSRARWHLVMSDGRTFSGSDLCSGFTEFSDFIARRGLMLS